MLINLAFIKAANGLFYFAMDYLAELEPAASAVLVRSPQMALAVRRRFPAAPVRVVGIRQAAALAWAASRGGEMVFTPSSHPIPWCSRQMVVVHDTYPFRGAKGAAKAALFFMAMRTSRASAGYINLADARAFLLKGGLGAARVRPSPNRMGPPATEPMRGRLTMPEWPVIGLFGTDSPKKNYERLFAEVTARDPQPRLRFQLYGEPNDYAAKVAAAFPDLHITTTGSGDVGLEAFIRSVDMVASAADQEGFSRPLALALALGVPCWIVDAPIFREFYGQVATFHAGVGALADALATLAPGVALARPTFTLPQELEQDFQRCVAWLKQQDARCR